MKQIIGYKFIAITDNGDYDEWWRETHLESPIYLKESDALHAIQLCKKKMYAIAKERNRAYISSQIDWEIRCNRNINTFLEQCQTLLMQDYKEIVRKMHSVEVVPVYALDTATDEFEEWNIGD